MNKMRFKIFMALMTLALWVCPERERNNIVHWMKELKKIRDVIEAGEAQSDNPGDFTLTLGFTRVEKDNG